jgi:chromosome segregation ATPase
MEKIDQLISKQIAQVSDMTSKLEKVNPMNNQTSAKDTNDDQFLNDLNSKLEDAQGIKDELDDMKTKLDGFVDEVEKVMQPLTVLNEREVKTEPEIALIVEKMKGIDVKLASLENNLTPNSQKI